MLTTAPLSICRSSIPPPTKSIRSPASAWSPRPAVLAGQPLCAECRRRPAITCIRGRCVVSDDHDMCRQCWRGRMDARKAAARQARRFRRF